MRKETVEIGTEHGKEFAGKYVFQEITWAKRSRIIQKHTKYHPISGHVLSSDFIAIQAETIWTALKEQPPNLPLTLEKLLGEENGVPVSLGETLSHIVNRLCCVTSEENAFLSESSDAKQLIQPSQISASVRNSDGPQPSLQNSQPKSSSSSPSYSQN